MACVVGVFISILSMSTGYMQIVEKTGHGDRAVVISQGALFEYASFISRANALTIADAPGRQEDRRRQADRLADTLAFVVMPKKRDGLDAYVTLRGIGPEGFALRPEVKLISGRMFNAGAHELIVGKAAQAEFDGLAVGSQVPLPEGDWTVTGTFESDGDARESELIADAVTLGQAMRFNGYKSVTVQLESADSFDQFKEALTTNPQLAVEVVRETEYLANQSRGLNDFLTVVAYVVGGIMALGATFGAMNTMYSAVSARAIEIATLRAIGFSARGRCDVRARRSAAACAFRRCHRCRGRLDPVQRQSAHVRKFGLHSQRHTGTHRSRRSVRLRARTDRRSVSGDLRGESSRCCGSAGKVTVPTRLRSSPGRI